ncbi:MAG: sulfatase-like hydrolase/transferase, partial [Proteobacteria bacterium]|nr:sulfatase-like hydrolase/transferase [Pseudomonadota bacterium]
MKTDHYSTFIKNQLSLLAFLPLIFVSVVKGAGDTPNVVFIIADDLGFNDVGYNGSEIRTPRLDAMANEGLQLDRFYAHPVCSPTRAALMTGQSPTRLGVIRPISKIEKKGLPLDRTILPQFFSEAGYQTLMVGKWHLGHARTEYLPTSRGFEHFYGHVTGGIGFWDKVHGGGYDWQRNGTTVREDGYTTHLIADEAVQLIEDRDTARPLFLYAAFNAPHLPNEAPEETINSYPDIENINRRTHAAMVTELDTAVGRIIDALGAADMLDNTIVWFISDNGGLIPGLYSARTANLLDRDGNPLLPDSPKPEKFIEFININNT